ncbi:hypothetical protein HA052_26465 [Chromobacterium haemolyticum]|uniref:Uncharacterized protein n=1 Tax=Chromobacterium fluminis TaxID=3044269 RepID=A0ABX0LGH0_9NEIS|nr:hypothetical protein [Chromobacterium haemolyticum]NHR08736.1 hypothetical protein [Chromobacterium haemolyticum]
MEGEYAFIFEVFFMRLFVQFIIWQLMCFMTCVVLIVTIPILYWPFLGHISWLDYDFSLKVIKVGVIEALLGAVLFFVRDVSLFLKGYR